MSKSPKRSSASPYEKLNEAISKRRVRVVPAARDHEQLAEAIVRAWSEEAYKERLLTFPSGSSETKISNKDRAQTGAALKEFGIDLGNPVVVLTEKQFAEFVEVESGNRSYRGISKTDVIFVLPEPVGKKRINEVKEAMLLHSLGV
jgi:hypothetical protein